MMSGIVSHGYIHGIRYQLYIIYGGEKEMARTNMSICEKRQDEIFEIIIHSPHIINWLSIGRLEPSADAICDAAHYMEKGSIEHTEMKEALKSVFEKLTNAKEIRY